MSLKEHLPPLIYDHVDIFSYLFSSLEYGGLAMFYDYISFGQGWHPI